MFSTPTHFSWIEGFLAVHRIVGCFLSRDRHSLNRHAYKGSLKGGLLHVMHTLSSGMCPSLPFLCLSPSSTCLEQISCLGRMGRIISFPRTSGSSDFIVYGRPQSCENLLDLCSGARQSTQQLCQIILSCQWHVFDLSACSYPTIYSWTSSFAILLVSIKDTSFSNDSKSA